MFAQGDEATEAQQQIARYTYLEPDGSLWRQTALEEFTYDSLDRLSRIIEKEIKGNDWAYRRRTDYVYPNDSTEIEQVLEWNEEWHPIIRTTRVKNSAGQILSEEIEEMDKDWELATRGKFRYTADGKLLEKIYQTFTDNKWVNADMTLYVWDARGRIQTEVFHHWKNFNWVTAQKTEYTYQGISDQIARTTTGNSRKIYSYQQGRLDNWLYQEQENDQWVDKIKRVIAYR